MSIVVRCPIRRSTGTASGTRSPRAAGEIGLIEALAPESPVHLRHISLRHRRSIRHRKSIRQESSIHLSSGATGCASAGRLSTRSRANVRLSSRRAMKATLRHAPKAALVDTTILTALSGHRDRQSETVGDRRFETTVRSPHAVRVRANVAVPLRGFHSHFP